jgi:predicted site-specific integrase-resolvase
MQIEDRIDRIRGRKETAARLNISLRTLRRLELRGEIERVQITERIVGYRDSAIERFLKERTGAA